MLTINYHKRFKKDYKLALKRGYNITKLEKVVKLLVNQEPLPEQYRDHELKGDYVNYRECHIEPDWLLVYKTDKEELTLLLFRTGTHSDLFKK